MGSSQPGEFFGMKNFFEIFLSSLPYWPRLPNKSAPKTVAFTHIFTYCQDMPGPVGQRWQKIFKNFFHPKKFSRLKRSHRYLVCPIYDHYKLHLPTSVAIARFPARSFWDEKIFENFLTHFCPTGLAQAALTSPKSKKGRLWANRQP